MNNFLRYILNYKAEIMELMLFIYQDVPLICCNLG